MAAYIKFLAGDFGTEEYRLQNGRDKLACVTRLMGAKKLRLSDITVCEVATEESVKKLGGTLGAAVVGGLLLGGVGALAGGLAGGQTTESTVIMEFAGGEKALAKVNTPMMEAIRAQLFNASLAAERGGAVPAQKKKGCLARLGTLLLVLVGGVLVAVLLNRK